MPDTEKRPIGDDEYYAANAKLAYYREMLNTALRNKNPEAFDGLMTTIAQARRTAPDKVAQILESSTFNESLSPEEIRGILKDDYVDYIKTLSTIRDRGFSDDRAKRFFGVNESDMADLSSLMYGKRFATTPIVMSKATTNIVNDKTETILEDYVYNPKTKTVNKYRSKK